MTLLALPEVADFVSPRGGMPTLDELANQTPTILRRQIAGYLGAAPCTVASGFVKADPRAPERGLVIGYSQLTDGTWAWSQYWRTWSQNTACGPRTSSPTTCAPTRSSRRPSSRSHV